jgi:lysophospholipid acyltransferase (LPLAT)-like uncharacterized protein
MRIRSRYLTKFIAWTILLIGRLLFATCRVRFVPVGNVEMDNPYLGPTTKRYLACLWHDQIVLTLFVGRVGDMAGLVSKHQDGSFVAETMRLRGVLPVRGSTQRGGAEALRQMLAVARERHIAITVDGPRGPRHRVKPGIVFLASHSGRPIVPVIYTCRRGWRIRGNWTDMLLPKPFTTIIAVGGPPVEVPPGIDRQQLAECIRHLEDRMETLEDYAERLARGENVAPEAALSTRRAA